MVKGGAGRRELFPGDARRGSRPLAAEGILPPWHRNPEVPRRSQESRHPEPAGPGAGRQRLAKCMIMPTSCIISSRALCNDERRPSESLIMQTAGVIMHSAGPRHLVFHKNCVFLSFALFCRSFF